MTAALQITVGARLAATEMTRATGETELKATSHSSDKEREADGGRKKGEGETGAEKRGGRAGETGAEKRGGRAGEKEAEGKRAPNTEKGMKGGGIEAIGL